MVIGSLSGLMLVGQSTAIASESVVLKYDALQRSIPVADLTTFAETGETSRALRWYIRKSGQDPQKIRETLTREVTVSNRTLDPLLNSVVGNAVLGQLSRYVHTKSGQSDETALRSALVLSASQDDRISLLELMQNYPTESVYVDAKRLANAYNELQALQGDVENILRSIGIQLF